MPIRLQLESFDRPGPVPGMIGTDDDEALEEVRLSAYEKGYAGGWDDALATQSEDQARIRDDLAKNLRDLSFTYHEARTHVWSGLDPLLRGMVEQVLPELMRNTLGASVVGHVAAEAQHLADTPIKLLVSSEDKPAVETALENVETLPVTVCVDPNLGNGQVRFSFADEERALDFNSVLTSIQNLVTQFLDAPVEERFAAHG